MSEYASWQHGRVRCTYLCNLGKRALHLPGLLESQTSDLRLVGDWLDKQLKRRERSVCVCERERGREPGQWSKCITLNTETQQAKAHTAVDS